MTVTLAEGLLDSIGEELWVLDVVEDCVRRDDAVPETLVEEDRVEILEGFGSPVCNPDGELERVPLTLTL